MDSFPKSVFSGITYILSDFKNFSAIQTVFDSICRTRSSPNIILEGGSLLHFAFKADHFTQTYQSGFEWPGRMSHTGYVNSRS